MGNVIPIKDHDWKSSLTCKSDGTLLGNSWNAALYFTHHDAFRGVLSYDAFCDRIYFAKDAPYCGAVQRPKAGDRLADHHVTVLGLWLNLQAGKSFAREHIQDGLTSAARHNTRHPLQEYLTGLEWDGEERVADWLHTYLGTERTEYTQAVGAWWLVSAVARAMRPGCQADHTIVLEGDQGIAKTTALRILAGDWLLRSLPDIRDAKAAAEAIQGKWIVEIGELDALKGSTATRIKDWLTRDLDTYRPPYGRAPVDRKRHCIFAGTTNEREGYLHDVSGARRFWPVRVNVVDRKALERDRDQLWAETVQLFNQGHQWWPTHEMGDDLKREQDDRFDVDVWEDKISKWLETRDEVAPADVLGDCLSIEPGKWGRQDQMRVGNILRRLGYHRRRVRTPDGSRGYVYSKGAPEND